MTNFFRGSQEANSPYQQYGLYLHPVGNEPVTLQADPEKLNYYTNKGFRFLGYVQSPGVAALGPRDIDRDDSGIPKGPDGSTHDRHPAELTPDNANVPWGFPLMGIKVPEDTPRTAALRGAQPRGGTESHARSVMREAKVDDKTQDRVMGILKEKGLKDPQEELDEMSRGATLPGRLVEQGVTRGMQGVDVTMPSVVPGSSATDKTAIADAIKRGEVVVETREVAPGETVEVLRRVARDVPGPADAPGQGGASEPHDLRDPSAIEQANQQQVRADAMKAEGKAEGRTTEPDPKPRSPRR